MINNGTPQFGGVFKQKRREVFVPLLAKLGYFPASRHKSYLSYMFNPFPKV